MSIKYKEMYLIEILQKTGLNYRDALVYFTLIKSSFKGKIVSEIEKNTGINRTTIYSILRKLKKLGCVKELNQHNSTKNATLFVAIEPKVYFSNLILEKKRELDEYKEFELKYSESLQYIYHKGIEFSYEELDIFIQPYLKPLIEKGWKVVSCYVNKNLPVLNYSVYEYILYCPYSNYVKENGFHVYVFGYNTQKDENTVLFLKKGLKQKMYEMISLYCDLENYELKEDMIEIFNNRYDGFKMIVKNNDLMKIKTYPLILNSLKKSGLLDNQQFYDVWNSIIIPIENKIYFLFAESKEILEEMVKSIYNIEKLKKFD